MITRSGKQIPYMPSPSKKSQVKPRVLQPEATIEEVSTSATGLGTHKRWIRPAQPPASAINNIPARFPSIVEEQPTVDMRFVTPEPYIPTEPPPHQKRPRVSKGSPLQRRERIGFPGIFNLAKTEAKLFIEVPEGREGDVLAGRVHDRLQLGLAQRPVDGTLHQGQQLLGPHGTMLVDEENRPILGSPFRTPEAKGWKPPRILGPCDTVLISSQEY